MGLTPLHYKHALFPLKKTDEIFSNYCQLFISKPIYKSLCLPQRGTVKIIERQTLAYAYTWFRNLFVLIGLHGLIIKEHSLVFRHRIINGTTYGVHGI